MTAPDLGPANYPAEPPPVDLDVIAARQIEWTGNVVSGYGEHGLATRLRSLAADLRERAAKQGGQ